MGMPISIDIPDCDDLTVFEKGQVQEIMPGWRDALHNIYEEIQRSETLRKDPAFEDIRFAFDGVTDTVYVDYLSHTNQLGNSLIAERITQSLLPQLRK